MKFILLVSIKRLVLSKKRNFYEFIEFYVKGQDAGQGHVDHFITTKCLRNVKSLQKKIGGFLKCLRSNYISLKKSLKVHYKSVTKEQQNHYITITKY